MKAKKYIIISTLALLVMAFLGGNAPAYNMAEYDSLNQGDEWSYSDKTTIVGGPYEGDYPAMPTRVVVNGTEVVNQVTTTKVESWSFGATSPDYECYVMDAEGLKLYKQNMLNYTGLITVFEPYILIFPAQFDLGEVSQSSYSSTFYDAAGGNPVGTGSGNLTSSIETVEDVRVPAGTFRDCLKVSFSASGQGNDGSTLEESITAWYARNVGVVKWELTDDWYIPGEGQMIVTLARKLRSATVAGVYYGCPATATVSLEEPDREDVLSLLRRFRDEVLVKDLTGTALVELYYQHAPEITRLLLKDADLRGSTLRCLRQLIPEIGSVLNGKKMLLSKEMVADIEALLSDFAEVASPRLQKVIAKLGKDMKEKAFLNKFGIILEE